jgi:hypothetical protein
MWTRILTALVALLLASPAIAEELRMGIFVGNNEGAASDLPLLFAVSDARKMHDLFVEYGHIKSVDATLIQNGSRHLVEKAFDSIHKKLVNAKNNGQPTAVIFYYSGHGDDEALHLASTHITHGEVRRWLENTGADVKIAMLDACQSGSAIRTKGGTRGPSFGFAVEVERTQGTAILTSSAASELSQESAEIGGGFFTHYLSTALLGAADLDRDGEVSLTEAYAHVHGETAFGTRDTAGSQTPRYDFDLVGAGSYTLTTLEKSDSYLSFQGTLDGTYSVWDETRKRYVAEVNGEKMAQLAVRPGTYYVHRRMPGWMDEATYTVRRGETLAVYQEDFVAVPYEESAAKGDLDRQVRRASTPDLSMRLNFGARTFGGNSIITQQYITEHPILGIEARFMKSGKTWFGFDILNGSSGGVLTFDEFGELPVTVGSTSGGASVGFVTVSNFVRAGIGGKAELLSIRRTFPRGEIDPQATVTVAAGGASFLGMYHGRFSFEFQFNVLLMALSFDELNKRPTYVEPLLSFGYRF